MNIRISKASLEFPLVVLGGASLLCLLFSFILA